MKSKTLLLIPMAFFAVGVYMAWHATFRGVQVDALMVAFGFIFAGLIAIIFIVGLPSDANLIEPLMPEILTMFLYPTKVIISPRCGN